MAMDPRDVKLRTGERAPRFQAAKQRTGWKQQQSRFRHEGIAAALASFGVAKVRAR